MQNNAETFLTLIEENFDFNDSGEEDEENQFTHELDLRNGIEVDGDGFLDRDELSQDEPATSSFSSCFGFSCFFVYSLCVIVATPITISLSPNDGKICDQPLRMWNIVHACILASGIFIKLWCFVNNFYFSRQQNDVTFMCKVQGHWSEFLQKMFNLLLFVWIVIGMVWTFSSSTCDKTAAPIYYLSFSVLVFDITIISLFCLGFFFVITTVSLIYFFFPALIGLDNPPPGATQEMLSELDTPVEYDESMAGNDTTCSICLCDYEKKELIRFLPCVPMKHKFHSACVDEWLKINKTCPVCKRPIDKIEEVKPTEKLDEVQVV